MLCVSFVDETPQKNMYHYYILFVHVGNSCVIKCSELAVATSNLLVELFPKYLDQVCYS